MLCPMVEKVQTQMLSPGVGVFANLSKAKLIVIKIVVLTALGLAMGFAQSWAATRTYKPDHTAGFHLGLLHGFLMPTTLPGLLMGNDLPIYAPNNSGRAYNIGYIFGINSCGMLYFGIVFWQPRRRPNAKMDRG